MNLYELPKFNIPRVSLPGFLKKRGLWLFLGIVFLSSFCGFLAGFVSGGYFYFGAKDYFGRFNIDLPGSGNAVEKEYIPQTSQEQAIVRAVKEVSPAVVSIVVTKDVPILEQYYYNPFEEFNQLFGQQFFFQIPQYRQQGTEKQEVGGGTGFIVSEDGLVLTNKHVVLDTAADYTVLTNDGKQYPAKVLARDPLQDLAVLKINQDSAVDEEGGLDIKTFPAVRLGNSDSLQIGQTVVAIGNALGEFRNTVSVGVVSGLARTITASGAGLTETLEDVIQVDAAINKGNSGGPLVNLRGEVVGINTAMVETAQSIGFALPINKAKRDIEQVQTLNKIVYPFLGVRYVVLNEKIQKQNNLSVNYGAWVQKGPNGETAVTPGSAAERAGVKEGDIILEIDGKKITTDNSLAKIIQQYSPGDKVSLKILRGREEKILEAVLAERND